MRELGALGRDPDSGGSGAAASKTAAVLTYILSKLGE